MHTTRIRLERETRDRVVKSKETMTAVVTRAMKSYLTGRRQLPPKPPSDIVSTTVTVDERIVIAFTDLAKASGYSFDGAVRLALDEELKDQK